MEEMLKYRIGIMEISEIKRKGRGEVRRDEGFVMRYSGVNLSSRPREGVAILVLGDVN